MTAEQPKLLSVLDANGVATITLNRPDRGNALDGETLALFGEALTGFARQSEARVIVLRGAGRHFCSGADVGAIGGHGKGSRIPDICMLLDEMPKPTIAVVHGSAIGAGCGLVACCDAVIATDAARFAVPEVRLGLAPSVLAPYLVRAVGARQARRYLLCGDRLSAAQALAIGLVHDVCAADDLEERVRSLAAEFKKAAPEAFVIAKQHLRQLSEPVVDAALLDNIERRFQQTAAGAEAREGIASLRDKRDPAWLK
jgi:methylglutaconyl-CoA hydratase